MKRGTKNDAHDQRSRPRLSGAQASRRKHRLTQEFPSLWESMEEDVNDDFADLWLKP